MNQRATVVSIAIAALVGALILQQWRMSGIQDQRDELVSQLVNARDRIRQLAADRDRLTSDQNPQYIALKHDCTSAALQMFHALGFNEDAGKSPESSRIDDYSSHYSRRLGRCLLAYERTDYVHTPKFVATIEKGVVDADERQQIGDFLWQSSDTKKYWEQKPIQCHESVPGRPETWCHSSSEWDDFEQELMSS